jgi:hypothetical protein
MLCQIAMLDFAERSFKMGNHISILQDFTLFVTLTSVFIVLVVTVLKVVKRAAFFQGKTSVLMAVALSILFLVGLSQFLVGPGQAYYGAGSAGASKAATNGSLLPAVALGVAAAVVLSQVLLLASKPSPGEKSEARATKSEHPRVVAKARGRREKEEVDIPLAKPKLHGRPKRGKLAQEQLKKEGPETADVHPDSA